MGFRRMCFRFEVVRLSNGIHLWCQIIFFFFLNNINILLVLFSCLLYEFNILNDDFSFLLYFSFG